MGKKSTDFISLRQLGLKYGFNARTIYDLVLDGVLIRTDLGIAVASLQSLQEGVHYIRCCECGAYMSMMLPRHLNKCSGISLSEYVLKHPDAPVLCHRTKSNKVKDPDQRRAQSEKLLARFQTPEGEVTRKQISEASKRMQASAIGKKCADGLRRVSADPQARERRRQHILNRWQNEGLREVVVGWHKTNKDLSNEMVAKARSFNTKKQTKLHLGFKRLMEETGVLGFQTEYPVDFYSVDEACPEKKVALEIDGCYWHSCRECGLSGPKDNPRTDASKVAYLRNRGWTVIRLWEHAIKANPGLCIDRVRSVLEMANG